MNHKTKQIVNAKEKTNAKLSIHYCIMKNFWFNESILRLFCAIVFSTTVVFLIKIHIHGKPNQINAAQDSIFVSESIVLDPVDYYYSNVIARSSYTMTQCRNEKLKVKKTGTEG